MKYLYKNLVSIFILSIIFSLVSCSNSDSLTSDEADKDAILNFTIKTRAVNDPLIKGGEGSFSSLALYIFNKTTGFCEYSELIPNFTPQAVQEYSRSVNVSAQTKIVYAVANYSNDANKTLSLSLNPNLTMQQLDDLTLSNTAITDVGLLMVGREEIAINTPYVTAEIPMKRLVARLDIYMFKNQNAENDVVELTSIKFVNQILNTRCGYLNTTMMPVISKATATGTITANSILALMPLDLSSIVPANAHTSFYTYQNIAASAITPNDNITPYLLISVKVNGSPFTYKGYVTDDGQAANKFSLLRNNVYRVIAMLNEPDNKLTLKTTIQPWSVNSSGIGHEVKDTDYLLNPFNGSNVPATTGIVQYPYVNNGVAINGTSYASYSFKLTAPVGAVWTATLTNGLDFAFNSVGSTVGKTAVSTGIARTDEYEIKVGASKSWGGSTRSTYMYITVDGVKLKINPLGTNNTRKFPGTNDTDILITQTKYQ